MIRPGKMLSFILGMLFKKPATVRYPFVKVTKPENFRGRLKFDQTKCIGCRICVRVCPSGAITIEKAADEKAAGEKAAEKRFKAVVHTGRCLYCGQCVDSCAKGALKCSLEFELACLKKEDMKVEI